jgi:hypothetical protein
MINAMGEGALGSAVRSSLVAEVVARTGRVGNDRCCE